jgi:NNP family nitrate/nitrite transporter-like MFS transporter
LGLEHSSGNVYNLASMKIFLLFIFWSLWFLNFSTRTVLSPLLPLIEEELAITHALAGSLFFYLSVGFTISVFMAGWISKYIGYKRSIIASFLALVLALIGFRFAETYYYFAAVSFFVGLTSGIYFPCAIPLITSSFSRENWGKAIAFHETAASSSFLAIPILVAIALRFCHWKTCFIMLSGVCLIAIIFFWMLAPDPRPKKERRSSYSTVLLRKDFWLVNIIWTINVMATYGIYSITPLFLVTERGLPLELANTIFGVSRIGGLLATILIGFVLDRYPVRKILLIILLITGLSTIGVALAQVFWLLVGMLIIQATVSVAFFPSAIMAISKITRLEERSTFMGITVAIASIWGVGIAPFGLGAVADTWNFQIGILVLGVLSTLSCVLTGGLKKLG